MRLSSATAAAHSTLAVNRCCTEQSRVPSPRSPRTARTPPLLTQSLFHRSARPWLFASHPPASVMSLLLDEQEDMYAAEGLGGYAAQTAAADFGLALTSHASVDYLSDAHMQQAESFSDESHTLFSKHTFAIKNEVEEEAQLRSSAAQMLDPFGFEPASPVLPHAHEAGDAMDEPQLFKHEHSVLSEFDAVPAAAAATSGSFLLAPAMGISNAHVPMRQNATPQPPVPMMAVPRRGAEIKIKNEIQVKHEPVSPTVSYITSPQSRLSSPMPALVSSPSIGDAALSPVLIGGVRSGSSAGESGSAGSGGSGSNSAAHSCASASDSESDVAFDEPVMASGSKPKKAAAASSKSNSNKGKAGRKRKSKAGSGNSSGAEQAGAADGSVGDEMDDAAGAAATEGAPGETNKRQQRLQRNRASAQLSRERKKQYMRLLEKQLKELAELNEGLSVQIRALTSENTALKTRLSALNMRERVQARYPKAAAAHTSASQASTASMQSSPMHAPSASPSGSSETDALSNPASPRSVEGDVPRNAKRVKVEAYSPPHAAASANSAGGGRPAGAFSARAGLLLFTLVCSVGLLYNFASVDVAPLAKPFDLGGSGGAASSIAAANVVLARGLGSPAPSPSRATVTLMSEGGGGGDEDVVVHRSHSSLTSTQPARGRVLASVSEDSDSANTDAFALVPLANSAPMEIIDEGDSKALDVYTRSSASSVSVVGGDEDSKLSTSSSTHLGAAASSADVQLLRRLLLSTGTNSSSAASEGTNFMFCPQSLSISRDTWTGLLHKHGVVGGNYSTSGTPSELVGEEKQIALFDSNDSGAGAASSSTATKRSRSGKKKGTVARLRKAIGLPQLPAPGSDTAAHKIDAIDSARAAASSLLLSDLSALPAVQSGLQVGDKLLLWVPLQLSSNSGRPNGTTVVDEGDQPKQGLVEIACHIAHVRPIVLS